MNKKGLLPAYLGVAFVWFTTQFGGGFASGRQLMSFFIKYGWYAIFTPIVVQAIQALILYYVFKVAREKKTYNYRSFTDELYGPARKVMSPLYEFGYNFALCLATAVAFATGGETLKKLIGLDYFIGTVIIAVIIFLLTIFGAKLVRKAATIISVMIVVGILVIFIPNIIHFAPDFAVNYANLKTSSSPFWPAMWSMFLYVAFQVLALGAYVGHADVFKSEAEVRKSMIVGFAINAVVIMLAVVGIISIYGDGAILKDPVPNLVMVQQGIGGSFLAPLLSVLIIIGSFSTGVNFIYGIVGRVTNFLARNESDEVSAPKERKRNIIVSLVYVLITFAIAQFGLIPLIAKGYKYLGYISIVVVILPVLIRFIQDKTGKTA